MSRFLESLNVDPFTQFKSWYSDAEKWKDGGLQQPSACTLATATHEGCPSARIVLYKGIQDNGLLFFTNYESRKSAELDVNPLASVVFHWAFPHRQVRVDGKMEKVSRAVSADYWKTRPRASQLYSAASKQSTELQTRDELEDRMKELDQSLGSKEVPLPDFWGGYRLVPISFEFWEGKENRAHDRAVYEKDPSGNWVRRLLYP